MDQVNRKYYGDDDAERKMEIKNVIYKELEEEGALKVESLREKVFPDSPEMQEAFDEKMEKYNLSYETVQPRNEQTVKKFKSQRLTTDTGIEITIPMEEYQNPDRVGLSQTGRNHLCAYQEYRPSGVPVALSPSAPNIQNTAGSERSFPDSSEPAF